ACWCRGRCRPSRRPGPPSGRGKGEAACGHGYRAAHLRVRLAADLVFLLPLAPTMRDPALTAFFRAVFFAVDFFLPAVFFLATAIIVLLTREDRNAADPRCSPCGPGNKCCARWPADTDAGTRCARVELSDHSTVVRKPRVDAHPASGARS